jgi:hypothetical protein
VWMCKCKGVDEADGQDRFGSLIRRFTMLVVSKSSLGG